jgi:His-Xaa-Ser system protein HxsD
MVEPDKVVPPFLFSEGRVHLSLDLRVYRLVAVQKTAYKFARKLTVVFGNCEENLLPATILFAQDTRSEDAFEVMRSFFQELLDQELRERIGEETHAIRSLILAQAFSRTDLIRRD